MLLLNLAYAPLKSAPRNNLHFNMLLLNRSSLASCSQLIKTFTFQYASIKPIIKTQREAVKTNLHFNMLLLNPIALIADAPSVIDLHFNMLLLNPTSPTKYFLLLPSFTFQYASIKPWKNKSERCCAY